MKSEADQISPHNRLLAVHQRITDACVKYGRDLFAVELIAVSKTRPTDSVRHLFTEGQRAFGENYLQEAILKVKSLADIPVSWHFIGQIQSNKCGDIANNFPWIHSVDRLKIAHRLSLAAEQTGNMLNIMIQINLQNEPTKAGIIPNELPQFVNQIKALPGLRLRGLMAIPRAQSDFDLQRRSFANLRNLRDRANENGADMDCLSMGMSDDLEAAIAEGATHIRVGTALFGPRQYTQ